MPSGPESDPGLDAAPHAGLVPLPEQQNPDDGPPPLVLSFHVHDPTGAAGLMADAVTVAAMGAHALGVNTGTWVRDSTGLRDCLVQDDDWVDEQARALLEDMPVQVLRLGFLGDAANVAIVAGIAADYHQLPLVLQMPALNWMDDAAAERYQQAVSDLLLPQTALLIGQHATLWRWLLPDHGSAKPPTARELARAAAQCGVEHTLITGWPVEDERIENVLAHGQGVVWSERFERIDAQFIGAGDTLAAGVAGLLALGHPLPEAGQQALAFLDQSLAAGFRPGMGQVLPDRMFWAQSDDGPEDGDEAGDGVSAAH